MPHILSPVLRLYESPPLSLRHPSYCCCIPVWFRHHWNTTQPWQLDPGRSQLEPWRTRNLLFTGAVVVVAEVFKAAAGVPAVELSAPAAAVLLGSAPDAGRKPVGKESTSQFNSEWVQVGSKQVHEVSALTLSRSSRATGCGPVGSSKGLFNGNAGPCCNRAARLCQWCKEETYRKGDVNGLAEMRAQTGRTNWCVYFELEGCYPQWLRWWVGWGPLLLRYWLRLLVVWPQ